ncbi:WD40 repeat-like protein [Wilcoxina mikolae CBS 423.85]|nr:WD40 repeat-like protein [Wilcoxina mikolae CBS 423.85]
MNGDLRLFRYIRSSWITHILHACALSKDKAQLEPLSNALQRLFSVHLLQGESMHSDMTLGSHASIQVRSGGRDISLRNLPHQEQLRVKKVVDYSRALEQKTGSEYTDWADENDPMDVSKRGRILQDILEGILEDRIQPEILAGSSCNYIEVFQKLYGQKLYKCRSPSCEASSEVGFETSAQRQLHEDKHARPYKCPTEDCFFKEVGFATKSALQKHRKDYHNSVPTQRTRKAKNLELLDRAKSVLRPGTPPRDQLDNDQLGYDNNSVPIIVDNFLTDVDQESIPPSHKKEGNSWIALFNPQISRELDVEFLHTLGNDDTVSDIGFSLDGRYIAVAASNSAEIYDVQTAEYVGTLKEDLIEVWNETIHSVRFSPDGKYLVTGGMNRDVMLWNVQNQVIRHRFIGHRQSINSVDFAINGKYIVSGSADRTIRVWDVYTGKNLLTLNGNVSVRSVAFSPNGKLIAAGSDSGEIHVWDSRSGHLQNQFSGHNSPVYSVSFSPLGVELFSGSMDSKVKIWPLAPTLNANQTFKHEVCPLALTMNPQSSVNSVASTPDGKWLLSASGGYVHFWQPATSNCHLGLETYTYMNYRM